MAFSSAIMSACRATSSGVIRGSRGVASGAVLASRVGRVSTPRSSGAAPIRVPSRGRTVASVITRRQPAWRSVWPQPESQTWSWARFIGGYMGTAMIPAAMQPKIASMNSTESGRMSATRSPCRSPAAWSAQATRRARAASSA